jgi:hypothetical protein
MVVYLLFATVLSTRLPINWVVVGIAALAMEGLQLGDVVIIILASLALDHLGVMPLGFSILPLVVMVAMVHVLHSRIYLHSFLSRFLWLMIAVFGFYGAQGVLLILRGGSSIYIWNALVWGALHAVMEGACAALMTPYFHKVLTISVSDLRRPKSIIV